MCSHSRLQCTSIQKQENEKGAIQSIYATVQILHHIALTKRLKPHTHNRILQWELCVDIQFKREQRYDTNSYEVKKVKKNKKNKKIGTPERYIHS